MAIVSKSIRMLSPFCSKAPTFCPNVCNHTQSRFLSLSLQLTAGTDDSQRGKLFKFKARQPIGNNVASERYKDSFGAEYLNSTTYRNTYGEKLVWEDYRRNFKGQIPKLQTRKKCRDQKLMISANPCPVCRDADLIIDYRNPELLKQFIHPYTKEVLHTYHTKVCQHVQKKIVTETEKAKLKGTLTFDIDRYLVLNN